MTFGDEADYTDDFTDVSDDLPLPGLHSPPSAACGSGRTQGALGWSLPGLVETAGSAAGAASEVVSYAPRDRSRGDSALMPSASGALASGVHAVDNLRQGAGLRSASFCSASSRSSHDNVEGVGDIGGAFALAYGDPCQATAQQSEQQQPAAALGTGGFAPLYSRSSSSGGGRGGVLYQIHGPAPAPSGRFSGNSLSRSSLLGGAGSTSFRSREGSRGGLAASQGNPGVGSLSNGGDRGVRTGTLGAGSGAGERHYSAALLPGHRHQPRQQRQPQPQPLRHSYPQPPQGLRGEPPLAQQRNPHRQPWPLSSHQQPHPPSLTAEPPALPLRRSFGRTAVPASPAAASSGRAPTDAHHRQEHGHAHHPPPQHEHPHPSSLQPRWGRHHTQRSFRNMDAEGAAHGPGVGDSGSRRHLGTDVSHGSGLDLRLGLGRTPAGGAYSIVTAQPGYAAERSLVSDSSSSSSSSFSWSADEAIGASGGGAELPALYGMTSSPRGWPGEHPREGLPYAGFGVGPGVGGYAGLYEQPPVGEHTMRALEAASMGGGVPRYSDLPDIPVPGSRPSASGEASWDEWPGPTRGAAQTSVHGAGASSDSFSNRHSHSMDLRNPTGFDLDLVPLPAGTVVNDNGAGAGGGALGRYSYAPGPGAYSGDGFGGGLPYLHDLEPLPDLHGRERRRMGLDPGMRLPQPRLTADPPPPPPLRQYGDGLAGLLRGSQVQEWMSQHASRLLLPRHMQDIADIVFRPPSAAPEKKPPRCRTAPAASAGLPPHAILGGRTPPPSVCRLALDAGFMAALLSGLEGVDPADSQVQAVVTALQGRDVMLPGMAPAGQEQGQRRGQQRVDEGEEGEEEGEEGQALAACKGREQGQGEGREQAHAQGTEASVQGGRPLHGLLIAQGPSGLQLTLL